MTATGHALIGTVIAAKVGNPVLAVPIAIASHFLADAFPHWDTGTNKKQKSKKTFMIESAFDVILGFVLSWILITWVFPETNLAYAFLIIIMAQLPDWLTIPYLFFGLKLPLGFQVHHNNSNVVLASPLESMIGEAISRCLSCRVNSFSPPRG